MHDKEKKKKKKKKKNKKKKGNRYKNALNDKPSPSII